MSLHGVLRLVGGAGRRAPRRVEVDPGFRAVGPLEGVVHVGKHVHPGVESREDLAVGELVAELGVSRDAGLDLEGSSGRDQEGTWVRVNAIALKKSG